MGQHRVPVPPLTTLACCGATLLGLVLLAQMPSSQPGIPATLGHTRHVGGRAENKIYFAIYDIKHYLGQPCNYVHIHGIKL